MIDKINIITNLDKIRFMKRLINLKTKIRYGNREKQILTLLFHFIIIIKSKFTKSENIIIVNPRDI